MNRREWLVKTVIYSTVGTALGAFGWILLDAWRAAGKFTSARWTDLSSVDVLKAEGRVLFPKKRVALVIRNQQVAAISLECTHLGCLVSPSEQGFFCPCHGSEFGPLGEVYSRPARAPLRWHDLSVRRGRIWIRTREKLLESKWVRLGGSEINEGSQEV